MPGAKGTGVAANSGDMRNGGLPDAPTDAIMTPQMQTSEPDPISKTRRRLLRVASRATSRPKTEDGRYDTSPLKPFERPGCKSEEGSASGPSQETSLNKVNSTANVHPVKTADPDEPSLNNRGAMKSVDACPVQGFQAPTSNAAGVVSLLYPSKPLPCCHQMRTLYY